MGNRLNLAVIDPIGRAGLSRAPAEPDEVDYVIPASAPRALTAEEIALEAQESIGEAYRSPFTYNAALEAAKIALQQTATKGLIHD